MYLYKTRSIVQRALLSVKIYTVAVTVVYVWFPSQFPYTKRTNITQLFLFLIYFANSALCDYQRRNEEWRPNIVYIQGFPILEDLYMNKA